MYLCTCAAYIRVGNKTWVFFILNVSRGQGGSKEDMSSNRLFLFLF